MSHPWSALPDALAGTAVESHARALAAAASAAWASAQHGDLPMWRETLAAMPSVTGQYRLDRSAPCLGDAADDPAALKDLLMRLHPWRKGPLEIGGVFIDTEWRSDWKWARVAPHVDLSGHAVLDVGCGNGYFGWRMLAAGARCVVGVDPTLVFVAQWLAQRHFAPTTPNFVLPLRDIDLPVALAGFDSVFSMGVLYHRRDPVAHLADLLRWLRPGGQLVLETLVVDRPGTDALAPTDRYARMRNVHHIPSPERLAEEVSQAGFAEARVVDVTPTSTDEQRSTSWMRFESLAQSLDPDEPSRTVEGLPAPVRAVLVARRPAAGFDRASPAL